MYIVEFIQHGTPEDKFRDYDSARVECRDLPSLIKTLLDKDNWPDLYNPEINVIEVVEKVIYKS